MAEVKANLEKVHIKNYRSLRDVCLPLKPLTVIVGPNACGKSNVLNALGLLKTMMIAENLPPAQVIQDALWAGDASCISFRLQVQAEEVRSVYELELQADVDIPCVTEKLSVNNVKVISIQNGKGIVRDENSQNETKYKSNKLALRSAGDYGCKPVTSALTEFFKGWQFYDFRPDLIRQDFENFPFGNQGSTLPMLLSYWYEHDLARFRCASESLEISTKFKLDQCTIGGDAQLCLMEGYKNPIPLAKASDGTLHLVAHYTLLNRPELPPLIAIEEPERNLHPGVLTDIANVLEQLANQSQVIITTHSSQLLDAFNPEDLSDSLCILLLRNRPGHGTEVINLEDIRADRAALDGWISDFGIGSAIFESELLQDLME